jgi:hypothetical protein
MLLAFGGLGSGVYRLLFLLHIVALLVAFAPAVAHPLQAAQAKSVEGTARRSMLGFMASNSQRVYGPALVLVGLFGVLMVGSSDGAWSFSNTWVWLALLVWIVMNGVLHALLIPAERRYARGDQAAERQVATGGQILTVLFLLMLFLMIWKPGV